jgi:hypothetical protein
MKYVFLILNWFFGGLLLLMGLLLLAEDILHAFPLILVSFLILPPVRTFVHSKTNIELSFKARAISIFVLLIAFWIFAEQNQEKKAHKIAAQARQETIDYFNANSARILSEVRTTLETNDYQKALSLSSKYSVAGNEELTALHNEAKTKLAEIQKAEKTEKLLVELRGVPESEYERNKILYQQLAALNPDNKDYQSKESIYTQKIAEDQEKKRQEQERAHREAAQKEVKDRLDTYVALLNAAEVKLVKNVSVKRIGDGIWKATLTVDNLWHVRHRQIRLQDTQTLWEAWAEIASPNEPDKAIIKIVDLRGNEVGGSRVLGGSLIWVQED